MATQALRSTSALEIKVLFKLQNDFLEDANKITCHGIWCRRHISDKQVIPCLSPEGRPKGALALTYSSEDDGCNSFPTTQRFVYYSPQASKKIGSWKAGTNLKNRLSFTTDLKEGLRWSATGMHCYWETWNQAELDMLLQHINTSVEELALPNNSSWNVVQTVWKYLKYLMAFHREQTWSSSVAEQSWMC